MQTTDFTRDFRDFRIHICLIYLNFVSDITIFFYSLSFPPSLSNYVIE